MRKTNKQLVVVKILLTIDMIVCWYSYDKYDHIDINDIWHTFCVSMLLPWSSKYRITSTCPDHDAHIHAVVPLTCEKNRWHGNLYHNSNLLVLKQIGFTFCYCMYHSSFVWFFVVFRSLLLCVEIVLNP